MSDQWAHTAFSLQWSRWLSSLPSEIIHGTRSEMLTDPLVQVTEHLPSEVICGTRSEMLTDPLVQATEHLPSEVIHGTRSEMLTDPLRHYS